MADLELRERVRERLESITNPADGAVLLREFADVLDGRGDVPDFIVRRTRRLAAELDLLAEPKGTD